MSSSADVIEQSRDLKKLCEAFADELAIVETRRDRLGKLIRAGFAMLGVVAMAATNMPNLTTLLGPDLSQRISMIAALALIVGSVGPLFISGDPPGRFHDYAHYIRGYCARIDSLIYHPEASEERQRYALGEINHLIRENINDVRNKWEWLARRVDRKLGTSAAAAGS